MWILCRIHVESGVLKSRREAAQSLSKPCRDFDLLVELTFAKLILKLSNDVLLCDEDLGLPQTGLKYILDGLVQRCVHEFVDRSHWGG